MRLSIGVVCGLAAVSLALWLSYLQWFVHPEYTVQMMFWRYWRIEVAAGLFGIVAVWGLEPLFTVPKSRRGSR